MKIVAFYICIIAVAFSCNNSKSKDNKFSIIKGKTDGFKYEIAYDDTINLKSEISEFLSFYSHLLNVDSSQSIIAQFNSNNPLNQKDLRLFNITRPVFVKLDSFSRLMNEKTNGIFSTQIHDLMVLWGFAGAKVHPETINQSQVEPLIPHQYGGLVDFNENGPVKVNGQKNLNYQTIYKSMLADWLAEMFDSVYHFKNYYINFGGDIRAKGNNGHDSYWPISIEKPMFNTLKSIEFCKIPLKNYGLATENSYKTFFFYKGKRFSHNINPITGFPERNELLSATILAKKTMNAKAIASYCMLMGLTKSIEFIEQNPDLKAFLIFEKDNQIQYWSSSNLSATISKQE